ncbi:hypothetical protein AWB68_04262 [Caballeronia choica]|uniref:Tetratricopeptide repeat protein n=1 Tax=Caballeronia choica TaxID=326476 RepID=A0A158JUH5_9BURK|nr:hypothetical protein [Caballeronia choica]SAL72355.1 hypothetical protein AWB68_04262 [Caballeronia choica]
MKKFDTYLSFGFGVVFCISILAVAVVVPHLSSAALFVCQILLALAAASVTTILLQHINIRTRIIRSGAPIFVFCFVGFANPPRLIAEANYVQSNQLLSDARQLFFNGDLARAVEQSRKASELTEKTYIELPYYLAIQDIDNSRYLSAKEHLETALSLYKDVHEETPISESDIHWNLAIVEESLGNIQGALDEDLERKKDSKTPGGLCAANLDIGRLSLLLRQATRVHQGDDLLNYALAMLSTPNCEWPTHKARIWGTYSLACAYALKAKAETNPSTALRYSTQSKEKTKEFVRLVKSLRGHQSFDTRTIVGMLLWKRQVHLYGTPAPCSEPLDIAEIEPTYVE